LQHFQQALKIFEDIGAKGDAETAKNLINSLARQRIK